MRPTQALSVGKYRHLRLTTKDVNKGFYKGNRTGAMGRHTKYGGYTIEWNRVRTYAVPRNLAECQLTPFVTKRVIPEPGTFTSTSLGPRSPELYLQRWKSQNGRT
jgi:large subunit ribosomal protein L41